MRLRALQGFRFHAGIAALAVAQVLLQGGPALADPIACQRAIAKAASTFAAQRTQAFAQCAEKKLAGKLAPNQDCSVEPKTAGRVLNAEIKLRGTIAKACGGKNKTCAATDTGVDTDDSLASIGWDIGTCPNFEGAGCANPIAHCGDIATCLACVAAVAGDQTVALAFAEAVPSAPASVLNKCQIAIGAQTSDLFVAGAKALGKCEDAILKGSAPGPCPVPGDGKTAEAIAKAKAKKSQAICKACGGSDKACGGADDLTTSEIGFAATCSAVTVPGGPPCEGVIAALADIADCTDCVTDFKTRCLDALAVPGLKAFPNECGAPPTPTPTPTVTATPTATPTPTATVTPPPGPSSLKCQRAIVKESSKFDVATIKTLQKCEARKLAGALLPATDCATESSTAARIAKADAKLRAGIAKVCGGANKICDVLDSGAAADEPLFSIGWQLGACPDLRGAGCANPLVDCADVGECLGCALAQGAQQSIALSYASLLPATPGSDLAKCQATIGSQATKFVAAKLKALAKCEDAILRGKSVGPCPVPGDGKADGAITKAESKMIASICQACGGADRACGGGDDLAVAAIGFPATCPAVAVPGGPVCAATIGTLDDLVGCVACLTEANVDCADFLTVPGLKAYPAECRPEPTATPGGGGTPTPSPTATSGGSAVCGNSVIEAGESCDDGNTVNCDTCPSDCHPVPTDCPTPNPSATRHPQQVRVTGPTELGAALVCLSYPAGKVGFPGTGAIGGRLSGFAGSNNVVDFNNAVQVALLPAGSQSQFTFTLSFDRCAGAPVPDVLDFTCVTKDASDTFGNALNPPTIVECTPTTTP
jgi:cysteine-rich repeat protein